MAFRKKREEEKQAQQMMGQSEQDDAGMDVSEQASAMDNTALETLEPQNGLVDAENRMMVDGAVAAKPKKKRNVKRIVWIVILLLVAGLVLYNVISGMLKGPAPVYVEVTPATTGDLEQILGTTGTISTGEKITVVSPVGAPVASVNAELGRHVRQGDTIFTYDVTPLEQAYRTAAAGSSISGLQKQQGLTQSTENEKEKADAQDSMNTFDAQAAGAKKTAETLGIEVARLEAANAADEMALGALDKEDPEYANKAKTLESKLKKRKAYSASVSAQLAAVQQEVTENITKRETMAGVRDVADKAVLDNNAKQQLGLQGVASNVSAEMAAADLASAQGGVKAPISGIVTALDVTLGAMSGQYTPMCVIESLDKIDVVIGLSRYDLERVEEGQSAVVKTMGKEYAGTLTKINGMATMVANESGSTNGMVNATISLSNPDANIKLGVEVNVDLSTGQAKGVVVVPLGAVNTDVSGTYAFVIENGVAKRRDLVTGMSNETVVEIVEGLKEGEEVILSSQNVMDGSIVSTDPVYDVQQGGIMMGMTAG